jgi:peptidoglycan/LPS O-acetylase OafA/YrhL
MSNAVSDQPHQRLAYLPALDGVRAFAVVAVMMFHGGLSVGTGGFLGVDAFFVLSGFLITMLLVSEWRETLTIRLGAFWARRARRLLPALFLVLLFVALYAAVIVPEGTYAALRLDALSALLYVGNWHFILVNSNYFNETASASPLIHTWSLAVEEQFYLIWPLVVLGIMRLTRSLRVLFVVCCVAAAASATEMWVLYRHSVSTNRVYLGTDTRAQCLFIGAALAVALVMQTRRAREAGRLAPGELWRPADGRGRLICATLGLVGGVAAIVMWVTLDSTSSLPYTGGFFLIGLATAGVIVSVVGAPRSPVPRLLSLAPIRYLGRISYGLYIWHWPLFIWVNESRTGVSGNWLFALRCLVTFAVSVASYHLVELPIRQGSFLRQARAWVVAPLSVVVVLVAMVTATASSSLAATSPIPTQGVVKPSTTGTTQGVNSPVRVLLLGDSIALTLGEGLVADDLQKTYNYQLSDQGILGCGVVFGPAVELLGQRDTEPPQCNGSPYVPGTAMAQQPWPNQWLNAMSVVHPNVVVLLAGRWEVVNREYQGRWTNILDPTFAAYVKSQLESASQLVTSTGAHMVFLTTPCTNEGEQPNGAPWPEDSPDRQAKYNDLIRQVAAEHPRTDSVVDLAAAACPGGHYATTVNGVVIRNDDGVHFLYPQAGPVLAPAIMPPIVAAGRAQIAGS